MRHLGAQLLTALASHNDAAVSKQIGRSRSLGRGSGAQALWVARVVEEGTLPHVLHLLPGGTQFRASFSGESYRSSPHAGNTAQADTALGCPCVRP